MSLQSLDPAGRRLDRRADHGPPPAAGGQPRRRGPWGSGLVGVVKARSGPGERVPLAVGAGAGVTTVGEISGAARE